MMDIDERKALEIYKAILRLDSIEDPFPNFGPDYPKIGDFVNPDKYYSYDFTYKINERPNGCPWTLEEIQSTYWICDSICYENYNKYVKFKSVSKIKGKRRFISFKNHWNLTAEIVDMPEKAKLIVDYKNGKYTLLELLKIFKEKEYFTRIHFSTILFDISGDEYLEAMEELQNEKLKV